MNNCNEILREKQQKYRHYHQVQFINMDISQVNKYYLMIKVEWQNKGRLLLLHLEKLLNNE